MHAKNSQAINTNCGLKLRLTCEEDCVCDNHSSAENIFTEKEMRKIQTNSQKKMKEERIQNRKQERTRRYQKNVCKVFYSG